ncbi:MAG: hypothetical protein JXQ67_06995 [Campylobacterales bacterium]|nr:hypothetical protein [Campylobacterales bacterium]
MSIKVGLNGVDKVINTIDEKYSLGISSTVSEGLVEHIEKTNPFIASLMKQ